MIKLIEAVPSRNVPIRCLIKNTISYRMRSLHEKVRCLKKEFDDELVRRLLQLVKIINEAR